MTPRDRARLGALALTFGLAAALAASPAAAVTTISSSAYGLDVDLSILSLVDVGVGPVAAAGGVAPSGYSDSQSLLSLNSNVGLVIASLGVTTGVLDASASSPFTPTPTGTATGTVNALSSGLDLLLGHTVLDISAKTLSSTSSVSGLGSLDATGSSSVEDLNITGLSALGGTNIDISGLVTPPANDVIVNDLDGLTIILNQQIHTGTDGPLSTSDGMVTNALVIEFKDFLLDGSLLNGDFIVGHSQADIEGTPQAGVPEPATWALMLTGFAGLGAAMRARRRPTAA